VCAGASEWIKAALTVMAVSVEDESVFSVLAFANDELHSIVLGSWFDAEAFMAVQRRTSTPFPCAMLLSAGSLQMIDGLHLLWQQLHATPGG
jgi:hypothetical protein